MFAKTKMTSTTAATLFGLFCLRSSRSEGQELCYQININSITRVCRLLFCLLYKHRLCQKTKKNKNPRILCSLLAESPAMVSIKCICGAIQRINKIHLLPAPWCLFFLGACPIIKDWPVYRRGNPETRLITSAWSPYLVPNQQVDFIQRGYQRRLSSPETKKASFLFWAAA